MLQKHYYYNCTKALERASFDNTGKNKVHLELIYRKGILKTLSIPNFFKPMDYSNPEKIL
jgi:hypothetical protein